VVTEQLRRWWLDRYSLDEIRELAAAFGWDGGRSPLADPSYPV